MEVLSDKAMNDFANEYAKDVCKNGKYKNSLSDLSGGNKQKVVLARWIGKDSDIVV